GLTARQTTVRERPTRDRECRGEFSGHLTKLHRAPHESEACIHEALGHRRFPTADAQAGTSVPGVTAAELDWVNGVIDDLRAGRLTWPAGRPPRTWRGFATRVAAAGHRPSGRPQAPKSHSRHSQARTGPPRARVS